MQQLMDGVYTVNDVPRFKSIIFLFLYNSISSPFLLLLRRTVVVTQTRGL